MAVGAIAAFLAAGEARPSSQAVREGPYDPRRDPSRDLSAAIAEARRDQKRVLLEVGGNWCGWCRELDHFVGSDSRLADALHCAFVVVRVNTSPENPNAKFLAAYPEIPGYPYFFVLDDAGALLASVDTDSFLRGESYDRAKMLAFIRKWTQSRPDSETPGS